MNYFGGTPLFDERTGKRTPLKKYLKNKGFNFYCDPVSTTYTEHPLFIPQTGRRQTRESYLKTKTIKIYR